MDLEREGGEEAAVDWNKIQVNKPFDNGHASGQQNAVNTGQLLGIKNVGNGKRLHPKDLYPPLDAPVGKLFANPGKLREIELPPELLAPVGVE